MVDARLGTKPETARGRMTEGEIALRRRFRLSIDPAIRRLAPSYSGVVLDAEGLNSGPPNEWSDELLSPHRARRRASLAERRVEALTGGPDAHPHMRAWAEVYRGLRGSAEIVSQRLLGARSPHTGAAHQRSRGDI